MKKTMVYLFIIGLASAGWSQLVVREGSNTYLKVEKTTGNVGVGLGEQEATAKLDVAGTVRFRGLVQGSLSHPVLAVDANGNLSVVEDQQGSGADGVVTGAAFSGTGNKRLTLTLSDASTVTADFVDDDQDDDADPNNEKPLAGNATSISGTANRNVNVNVDNKSVVIDNNQLKALPLLRYPSTGPRSVLVLFDANGPIQVQYKDGTPNHYDCNGGDPAYGWNTASSANYQFVDWDDPSGAYDGNGIHVEKELLSPAGNHYRAISARMGGWRCLLANNNTARMYAGQSHDAYLQEIAGQGGADDLDADGLVTLDDDGGVYVMSQFQQRTDRDLRLILFTVFSYIGEQ
jgi:hypothetical protein